MTVRTRAILSLIINAGVFLATTTIVITSLFIKSEILEHSYHTFMFFTTDSNILTAIASALVMICEIKILQGKRTTVARAFTLLKYAGVVGLMLTFFTVLCLLIPIYGIAMEWGGTGLHVHVLAPVLSFVSFVFLEQHTKLSLSDAVIGILPVIIYGAVYFLQVVVIKNWMDFYAFNSGGRWYLIMPLIIAISFAMSLFVRFLRNKVRERTEG